MRRDDGVYLTDKDFGLRDAGASSDKQMPNGVWLVKDRQSRLVLSAEALGGIPNGVALSPDERYLYLTALQKLMRYEVQPDGSLASGMLFTEGPGDRRRHEDRHARQCLFDQRRRARHRANHGADGTLLGYRNLPIYGEPKRQICATNVAFGDGKSLFITACDVAYEIRLKVAGLIQGRRRVVIDRAARPLGRAHPLRQRAGPSQAPRSARRRARSKCVWRKRAA